MDGGILFTPEWTEDWSGPLTVSESIINQFAPFKCKIHKHNLWAKVWQAY